MKKIILCASLLAASIAAHGQGAIYFTAHLTYSNSYGGDGSFSLSGNSLAYDVQTYVFPGDTAAHIRSRWTDTNAPIIFALPVTGVSPGIGGSPWHERFQGTLTLSDEQLSDFLSGQWSVSVPFPSGRPYFEGQIVAVPEPHALLLLSLGLGTLWFYRCRKMESRGAKHQTSVASLHHHPLH